jgi:hypothetical protein
MDLACYTPKSHRESPGDFPPISSKYISLRGNYKFNDRRSRRSSMHHRRCDLRCMLHRSSVHIGDPTAAGACWSFFMNFLSASTNCSRPNYLACWIGSAGKSGALSGALFELKFSTCILNLAQRSIVSCTVTWPPRVIHYSTN